MKKMTYAALVALLAAAPAYAGTFSGLSAAGGDIWTGPYGGLELSHNSGNQGYSSGWAYKLTGDTGGLFLGYNLQQGNIVYGGELLYSSGDVVEENYRNYRLSHSWDVKGRLGYAVGKSLFYTSAGYTAGHWVEGSLTSFKADGYSVAAGMEYLVGQHAFIGAEYSYHKFSGSSSAYGLSTKLNVQEVTLRAGVKF